MNKLAIIFVFLANATFGFNTPFADSMLNVASQKPGVTALDFMLDNYYPIFNKDFEDGIEWVNTIKNQAETNNLELQIGRSNLCLGTIHYLNGDYELAIAHYQTALDQFEALDNDCYKGRTYNEMSVYYRKQKQFEKSLEVLALSYDLCNGCGDQTCVETSHNNRGVVFEMMGDYDKAKEFYRRAEVIAIKNDNQIGLSYIYNNFAECFRLTGDNDSVYFYLEKSTEIRKRLNDYQGVAINFTNMGEFYLSLKNYQLADENLLIALEMAEEVGYPDLQKFILSTLAESKKQQGEFDEALEYIQESNVLQDSLLNIEKIKSLSEMEVRYETQKVELKYAEEQQKRAETELEVANRNNWIIGIAGASVIAILFGFYSYQRKKKQAEIDKNLAVLNEKEKGLKAVFDATEEERQRISKDLHDSVGQQMSGLKMAWDGLSNAMSETNPEQASKLNQLTEILDEAANEVRDISHQMMPMVLMEIGLSAGIKEMLDKSLRLTNIKYEFEEMNISGRFDNRIEVSLYRVCQELVNNVIKHSGATFLSVQLFKNQNQLILIVEDNGKGMKEEKTDGHGLMNIKSRLNTINGDVNYVGSENAGTIATIRVLID
ncbi:MAG: sensor histidine kinase [Crocinitomicaceae bacterium]